MLGICRHCRRIQESKACGECGRADFADWPYAVDLFRRDEAVGVGVGENPQGWGCLGMFFTIMSMVAGGAIGMILLLPFGEVAMAGGWIGLVVGVAVPYRLQYRKLRMKRQSRLGPRTLAALPPARDEKAGTARTHQPTMPSLLTGAPCLASAVVAERTSDGKPVLERVEAGSFWLEADGERILVLGELKLVGDGKQVPASSVAGRRALALGDLQVPELAEVRLREIAVLPGAPVTVAGRVTEEPVPDLGYRGGQARVMRGVPGAPVVVRVAGDTP